MTRPRIAIAHDYLTQRGGAERVVLTMQKAFPDAPIYTTLYDPDGTYPEFAASDIRTSWLNRVPAFRRDHRLALPLLPSAVDSLHIDADIVVVSSSGWAHGFPTTGRRLVYCYSPARWVYLTDTYLGAPAHRSPVGLSMLALRPYLRRWDQARARRAAASGQYLAISTVVAERTERAYGFTTPIVPAPHVADPTLPRDPVAALADWADDGWLLVVSRLLPYKNVDAAIEAVRGLPHHRLVVVGRGPELARLQASKPDNVRMLQGLSDAELRWVYAHATTLVAPSFEDFGLTPLEAGAFGTPTVALKGGGYLDTIDDGTTGLFFPEPTPDAVRAALLAASEKTWDANVIATHMETFSEERFIRRLREEVERLWSR